MFWMRNEEIIFQYALISGGLILHLYSISMAKLVHVTHTNDNWIEKLWPIQFVLAEIYVICIDKVNQEISYWPSYGTLVCCIGPILLHGSILNSLIINIICVLSYWQTYQMIKEQNRSLSDLKGIK